MYPSGFENALGEVCLGVCGVRCPRRAVVSVKKNEMCGWVVLWFLFDKNEC